MFIENKEINKLEERISNIERIIIDIAEDIRYLRRQEEKTGTNKRKGEKENFTKIISEFIEHRREKEGMVMGIISAKDLYKAFQEWQNETKGCVLDISNKFFGSQIGSHYTRIKGSEGNSYINIPIDPTLNININNVEKFIKFNDEEGRFYHEQIPASIVYEAYIEWCTDNNELPTTRNRFGAIAKNKWRKKRGANGYVYLEVTLFARTEY